MIALSIICGIELLLIVLSLRGNWKIAKERNKFRRESKKWNNEAKALKSEVDRLNVDLSISEKKNKEISGELAFLRFICTSIEVCSYTGGPIKFRRGGNGRF